MSQQMSQLPADCLYEVFESLEDVDLRSCLLVNRLWCQVSVRFFWKKIKNYHSLIACLPDESKRILSEKNISKSKISIIQLWNVRQMS